MRREKGIFIKATEAERKAIAANAASLNTNVSRLLRFFGLQALSIFRAKAALRQISFHLNYLKVAADSTESEQVQEILDHVIEQFVILEEALREPEPLTRETKPK